MIGFSKKKKPERSEISSKLRLPERKRLRRMTSFINKMRTKDEAQGKESQDYLMKFYGDEDG